MSKLFYYELKRLLLRKWNFGFLAVLLFYAFGLMQSEIIMGIANTAPFSPWSFAVYFAKLMPILLTGLVCFLSFFCSEQEKRAEQLINSVCLFPKKQKLVRLLAALTAFLFSVCCAAGVAFGIYGKVFGFTDFFSLVPAGVAVILPPAALVFGVGCIAATAEKHADKAVFALCIPILIPAFFHEISYLDWYGIRFWGDYAASFSTADPLFSLPPAVLLIQSAVTLTGFFLFIVAEKKKMKR